MKKVFTLVVLALFGFFAVSCNTETESDISSLKNSISTIEQQVGSINTSITALESFKSAVDAKVSAFEEDNTSSKAEVASLKEQSEKLSKEIESLKTYVDELKGTKSWAEASFATLQQMEDLETSVAAIKASLPTDNNISEAVKNLETSIKSWVGVELLDYSTTAAMEARVAEAKQAAKDADDELKKDLKAEVKAVSDDLATVKSEFNDKVKALIEEAVAAGGVVNDEIAKQVKAAQNALNTKISALDTRVTSLESRMGIVEGKVSVIESQIISINASIATLKSFSTAIDRRVTSLEADNTKSKEDIANLKTKLDQIDQEIEDLRNEFDNNVSDVIDAALEEGGSINDEIASQVKTAVDSLEAKLTTINEKLTDLDNRVKALEDGFAELLGRIQSVVVVPTYTDGSVDVPGEVKFDIQPVEAAKALVALEGVKDSLKFQAVSVATKGDGSNFNDFVVESVKMDDLGDFVVVSVALPSDSSWLDTFKDGTLNLQARLLVEANSGSGNYVSKTSKYFPVNYVAPSALVELTDISVFANRVKYSVIPAQSASTMYWISDVTAKADYTTDEALVKQYVDEIADWAEQDDITFEEEMATYYASTGTQEGLEELNLTQLTDYVLSVFFLDKDGNLIGEVAHKEFKTTEFTFTVPSTSGTYTYTGVFRQNFSSESDLPVTFDAATGELTISNWIGGHGSLTATFDASGNGKITKMETPFSYGSYGKVKVCEYVDYANGGALSYINEEENRIYFHIVYYVDAGYLTYGWEYFDFDNSLAASPAAAMSCKKPEINLSKNTLRKISERTERQNILIK